jgi:hypothetical protein
MRSILPAACLFFFACVGVPAGAWAAPLLLEENFSYTPATYLTDNGWDSHSGTTNPITVTNEGLVYSGYPSSEIGNAASLLSEGQDVNRTFVAQTSGSVYYAALVKVWNAHANGDYFVHLGRNPVGTSNFYARLFCRSTTGGINFGISRSDIGPAVVWSPVVYPLYVTHLLVVKYTFVPGSLNDTVDLFINPSSCPGEPLPAVTSGTETTAEATQLGSLELRQGSSPQAPILWVDGVRVGTDWTEVVCGEPVGACCTTEGICSTTTEVGCLDLDHTYRGDYTTCDPNPCPQLGTCCALDLTCTCVSLADCGGTWYHGGNCSPNPCNQAPGACCDPTGACSMTFFSQCGGGWTEGLTCEPNLCPKPSGSCCDPYGRCTVTLATDCTGPWTMFGSCAPGDCILPAGACCHPEGTCEITLQDDCPDPWMLNGGCEPSLCVTSGLEGPAGSALFHLQGSPNPFMEGVTLRVAGPKTPAARVRIFDAAGRLVRTVWTGALDGSLLCVTWNGRDDAGRETATGVYMVRLESAAGGSMERLVRLR